jgi:hypothetical protein
MKLDIYIPEELSDITLGQYQKFAKINTGENENTSFLLHKMVEIFCNIDLKDIAKIKYTYVNNIVSEINKMFDVKTSLIPIFKMGGINYGFIPKLDDITLGEYIDLDNTLGDWETMHKAMSVLYRPVKFQKGHRYQIEDYTGMENDERMKNMPLDVVMGSLVFFWSLRNELLKNTLKYLSKEMTENLTTQQRATLVENGDGINLSTDWLKEILLDLKTLQN